MQSARFWSALAIPLAGAGLIGLGLALHRGNAPEERAPAKSLTRIAPSRSAPEGVTFYVAARSEPPPKLAPEQEVAQAADLARIRSTYQNYRTALATGNEPLQKSLLPVLLRDRSMATRFANEDLARAASQLDKDIAHKVVDSLRR